ncbi:MAG TPA: SEC-C metal-binding domain-containing protein [Candidatus Methylomirabilis sp.]
MADPGPSSQAVRRDDIKVGQNDPSPCESGRKFKRCCDG